LPACLGEGQIAQFIENDEVEAGETVGDPSLATGSAFGLELIEEIDGGEEAPAGSRSDAASRDRDGQMCLARSGPAADAPPRFARPGGSRSDHDPPPGNTVLWRGLARLNDILLGTRIAQNVMGN